jgi:hypothetical protein
MGALYRFLFPAALRRLASPFVRCASLCECLSAVVRNSEADDLNQHAASVHDLALRCCKAGTHKARENLSFEAVDEHEQRLIGAVRTGREQQ